MSLARLPVYVRGPYSERTEFPSLAPATRHTDDHAPPKITASGRGVFNDMDPGAARPPPRRQTWPCSVDKGSLTRGGAIAPYTRRLSKAKREGCHQWTQGSARKPWTAREGGRSGRFNIDNRTSQDILERVRLDTWDLSSKGSGLPIGARDMIPDGHDSRCPRWRRVFRQPRWGSSNGF